MMFGGPIFVNGKFPKYPFALGLNNNLLLHKRHAMKKQPTSMTAIAEILERRVIDARPSPVLNLLDLVKRWSEIVGPDIARQTTPLRIHGGTLTLQAAHSTWANELQMMALKLLEKIHEHCPQLPVKRLRFIA
jgi:predicted nucleic acid-binding Zn ribbon protein